MPLSIPELARIYQHAQQAEYRFVSWVIRAGVRKINRGVEELVCCDFVHTGSLGESWLDENSRFPRWL